MDQNSPITRQTWADRASKLTFETRHFIDGNYVAAKKGGKFKVINPATGAAFTEVEAGTVEDIDSAVAAGKRAYYSRSWSRAAPRTRMAVLFKFADLIDQHASEFALLDTLCMGKPVNDMLNIDIPGSSLCIRYFAEAIDKIEGAVTATDSAAFHYILREPLGVVGQIVPWNYPLMMAVWKISPALAAGNSVVLKPAEQSPLSALLLAKLFIEAGGPPGVFNVVNGNGRDGGRGLGLAYGCCQNRLYRFDRSRQNDAVLCGQVQHETGGVGMRWQNPANFPGRFA